MLEKVEKMFKKNCCASAYATETVFQEEYKLHNFTQINFRPKICIKYRKHRSFSFSHTAYFNLV